MMTDSEREDLLERILRSYCPNDGHSAKVIDKMARNSDTDVLDYVIALADGLKYGNWPWNRYGGTVKEAIKNTLHKSNEGEEYIPSGHIDPLTGEKI